MSSRIEQIIEEIEVYVESSKYQPLSTTKIVVNKEELEELLRELRLKTPDEIKRYQKIISNKDAILADAQNKADAIIAEAQAKAREMVEQSEVMQSAYAQANETVNNANQQAQEILDAATNDANSIRLGAIGYTDDMLANLSNIMTTALNDAGEKYNSFVILPGSSAVLLSQERLVYSSSLSSSDAGSYSGTTTSSSGFSSSGAPCGESSLLF